MSADGMYGSVRRRVVGGCGAVLFILSAAGSVQAASSETNKSDLALFQQQVGQWLALKSSLAAEGSDGRDTERRMREEIRLLEARVQQLEGEKARLEGVESTRDAEQEALMRDADEAERVLQSLDTLPDGAEALRRFYAGIPEPLQPDVRGVTDELDRAGLSGPQRLRLVLDGWEQMARLQQGTHVVTEVMEIRPGESRETEVLYLGLSSGYAVTGDGRWAALGHLGETGWVWREAPEQAPVILRALRMSRGGMAPELVRLPVNASGEGASHE